MRWAGGPHPPTPGNPGPLPAGRVAAQKGGSKARLFIFRRQTGKPCPAALPQAQGLPDSGGDRA